MLLRPFQGVAVPILKHFKRILGTVATGWSGQRCSGEFCRSVACGLLAMQPALAASWCSARRLRRIM